MKNGLSLVLLVVSALAAFDCFGQQEITVTATAANTVASRTSIDLPGLANNPNAIIVATPLGTTNPNPIGAWYYNNNWNVFNITHAAMPIGSKFKVEVFLTPGANQFLHIVNNSNLTGGISFIDNPGLNNKPNAQPRILQKHATGYNLNPFEATAQYDQIAGKWYIKNVNGSPLYLNTAYNVVITSVVSTIVLPNLLEIPISNLTNQPTTLTSNAGGDLSGYYPVPKVVGLYGRPLSAIQPKVGDILRWDGTEWMPTLGSSKAYIGFLTNQYTTDQYTWASSVGSDQSLLTGPKIPRLSVQIKVTQLSMVSVSAFISTKTTFNCGLGGCTAFGRGINLFRDLNRLIYLETSENTEYHQFVIPNYTELLDPGTYTYTVIPMRDFPQFSILFFGTETLTPSYISVQVFPQ